MVQIKKFCLFYSLLVAFCCVNFVSAQEMVGVALTNSSTPALCGLQSGKRHSFSLSRKSALIDDSVTLKALKKSVRKYKGKKLTSARAKIESLSRRLLSCKRRTQYIGITSDPKPNCASGDFNSDSFVDLSDLAPLFKVYRKSNSKYDLTGDGKINESDLKRILSCYGLDLRNLNNGSDSSGSSSSQSSSPTNCGNSIIEPGEQCDNGNTVNGDGCDNQCRIENGWSCHGQPSQCSQGGFQAPIGIPAPAFGISETVENTYGAGYRTHYVDNTNPNCSDDANGTPTVPRCTIPDELPAGSVVEVHGPYDTGGEMFINASGTVQQPVFIRGASSTNRPTFTLKMRISGSYTIFENILLAAEPGGDAQDTGKFDIVDADAHHISLRSSEITGTTTPDGTGGVNIRGSDMVIYNNSIHDTGYYQSAVDADDGGGFVDDPARRIYFLDNICYRNGRACVGLNPGYYNDGAVGNTKIQYVYVGRNIAWNNREVNFWSKHSSHVVFSQNISYAPVDNRPGNSPCSMGFQYAPEDVWFIFNQIFDSANGICLQSNSVNNPGLHTYMVGNTIHNISGNGILLRGGQTIHLANNTINAAKIGLSMPEAGASNVYLVNSNIISNSTQSAVNINRPQSLSMQNLLSFNPTFSGACTNCQTGDPKYVSSTGTTNFSLLPTSPAIDHGSLDQLYQTFMTNFPGAGNIQVDFTGKARPQGQTIDIGAFEK